MHVALMLALVRMLTLVHASMRASQDDSTILETHLLLPPAGVSFLLVLLVLTLLQL
jgi:hypothetical protein